jgi:signal transduction histidine kinase
MLYYFLALCTAALILLIANSRSETNRWAFFFLISASIGGLTDVFSELGWDGAARTAQFLNHVLTPYGVLIFCIVYSERVPGRQKRYLKGLLLLPAAVMLYDDLTSPGFGIHYRLLLVWAAPYYLLSCYLLLKSLWLERDPRKKRNRLITSIIMVPTLLAVLGFINVGNAISPGFDFFPYVSLFIWFSLLTALLSAFVYGVLGIRFRMERDPIESAMHAASSGAALLNHTLKNELGKIAVSVELLRPGVSGQASEHLETIARASDHLLDMAARIHHRMKDFVLQEQVCRLDQLAEECLQLLEREIGVRGIRLERNYACRPEIWCDPVHIKEAVNNVLRNAVEAMPQGGELRIGLDAGKRGVRLTIRDSGPGIPPERISRVIEPFYSTKPDAQNFGLGLSYVYNVMRKSGGTLELSSAEGEGTRVELRFPRRKVLRINRRNER